MTHRADRPPVFTPATLRVCGAAAAIFATFLLVVTVAELWRRTIGLPPDLNVARAASQTTFWAYLAVLHFTFARDRDHNRKDNP